MSGLQSSNRWTVLTGDAAAERTIASGCGVAPIVARALVSRGVRTVEEARRFLTPSLERDWLDPLIIPGMREVAERVRAAIEGNKVIAVFGDFDVDGMSATCLLTLGLRQLGAEVYPYIPDRFSEGYGLSRVALERVIEDSHPQLLLTVDNGIAARNETTWLLDQGIDVAVTDHHEPAELVPVDVPVADPKLETDNPSRELAGAGVALKLLQVLGGWMGQPELWRHYTEVATLGTISDMMLLAGENRALVTDGIGRMRQTERPGIVALAATARQSLNDITADQLPFSLIPRLNAAGRMGQTKVAFDLLMAGNMLEAQQLAARLEDINTQRRDIESALADEVLQKVEDDFDVATTEMALVRSDLPHAQAKEMLNRINKVDGVDYALGFDSIKGGAIDTTFTRRHYTRASRRAYDYVVAGMRSSALGGTCKHFRNFDFPICGKTGTAQNRGQDHSVCMAFAPMDNPKIAIAVYVENGGFGADFAVPMAGVLLEQYVKGKLSPARQREADELQKRRIAYGSRNR